MHGGEEKQLRHVHHGEYEQHHGHCHAKRAVLVNDGRAAMVTSRTTWVQRDLFTLGADEDGHDDQEGLEREEVQVERKLAHGEPFPLKQRLGNRVIQQILSFVLCHHFWAQKLAASVVRAGLWVQELKVERDGEVWVRGRKGVVYRDAAVQCE